MRLSQQTVDNIARPVTPRGASKVVALSVVGVALLAGISATVWALKAEEAQPVTHAGAVAVNDSEKTKNVRFPVTIREPDGPPRVSTGIPDAHGNTVKVACATCHTTRQPDFTNKTPADLKDFHVGLQVSHGSIRCLSCHNPKDYDSLQLADGSRVEFSDVMKLCAQCHGSQMRDFEHNAHGGLSGYWDRTRGPQTKLNCVDCHHPHAPQFPKMRPTFKPRT